MNGYIKNICAFLLIWLTLSFPAKAQLLDSIIPVTGIQNHLPDSNSFILTSTDYNVWLGLPAKYASSIQIIDATRPWPPRWFATSPLDVNMQGKGMPMINAFEQDGNMIFTNAFYKKHDGGPARMQEAVFICNNQMYITDTFYRPGKEIDGHAFAMNEHGEKLCFLVCDTMMDMRSIFGNTSDSMVSITYEKIQIANNTGQTIFSWNPIEKIGLDGIYKPYIYEKSIINNHAALGWSHGNSLCWDKDGNILYSYKYIGIGKISRQDGHFMWRVDRNLQKPGAGSDSLPIFLQHDLQAVKTGGNTPVYSVLSNGDSLHPFCNAYEFTVTDNSKDPHLSILKRITGPPHIPQTGAGNYDVEENGNYLINYGIYRADTVAEHLLFEYRNKEDKILAQYSIPYYGFCYRVHKLMDGPIPPRPQILKRNGELYAGIGGDGTWYQLSGKNYNQVTKVATGNKFKPTESGYYCLAVKYGIGYAVSEMIRYEK